MALVDGHLRALLMQQQKKWKVAVLSARSFCARQQVKKKEKRKKLQIIILNQRGDSRPGFGVAWVVSTHKEPNMAIPVFVLASLDNYARYFASTRVKKKRKTIKSSKLEKKQNILSVAIRIVSYIFYFIFAKWQ